MLAISLLATSFLGPILAPDRDLLQRFESLPTGGTGSVTARLVLDPRGRPIACSVMKASGNTEIDQASCRRLQKHATFRPAIDESKRPTYSTYDIGLFWKGGKLFPHMQPTPVAISIQVNHLPFAGLRYYFMGIVTLVSQDGAILDCKVAFEPKVSMVAASSRHIERIDNPPAMQDLRNIACEQVKQNSVKVILDENGRSHSFVQPLQVGFEAIE